MVITLSFVQLVRIALMVTWNVNWRVYCMGIGCLFCFGSLPAAAQLSWQGTWKTDFGEIRLIQQGKRVYGDYGNFGVVEGLLSANSTVYRGTFQRDDGKWGTFHFQRLPKGYRFKGHWRFSGITRRGDKAWSGKRLSGSVPDLQKAIGKKRYWARAISQKPQGQYKTFFDNKPRGIKLPIIPGVSLPNNPAKPLKPVLPPKVTPPMGDASVKTVPEFGVWHRSWLLDAQSDAYEIRLDIDHLKSAGTAQAQFSFWTLKAQDSCPRIMHPALCDEMQARFAANDRTAFGIAVDGVEASRRRLKVSFHFKNDRVPRLLIIEKSGNSPTGYRARLYHRQRGLDMAAFVKSGPHFCVTVQCTDDRLKDLIENPVSFRGVFSDGRYELGFPLQKDERQAFHEGRNRERGGQFGAASAPDEQNSVPGVAHSDHSQPDRSGRLIGDVTIIINPRQRDDDRGELSDPVAGTTEAAYQNNNASASPTAGAGEKAGHWFSGDWQMLDLSGETLGSLSFETDGAAAAGHLYEQILSGTIQPAQLSLSFASSQAATYQVDFDGVEAAFSQLLISLPDRIGGEVRGTFIQGQFWQLVRLVPGTANVLSPPEEPDERDFDDLPGSGVTGPAYRLRSVPEGRSVMLRQRPDRSSAKLAPLASHSSEILVLGCVPAVNPVAFDQADRSQKHVLLGRSWCRVSLGEKEGYLPGIYLDPILDR